MLDNYTRIIITGDIFRANHAGCSSQNMNINWLFECLKKPIQLATSLNVEKRLFSTEPDSLTQAGYNMIGESLSIQAWAKLFYTQDYTEQFLKNVWFNFRNSIVVAFEIPEVLRSAFNQLNIPFIDIIIHPVRFLDDIIFGIRTNELEISKLLVKYIIPEEFIVLQSGIVMAAMSRLQRLSIKGRTALFAGQTADDKVLIKDGKFMKVHDFLDHFSAIASEYDNLLIKPHPYSSEPFETISISRLFSKCNLVNKNFYYLMSHDNIEAVYSISSSTSFEAKYFEKKGFHFAHYPFKFVEIWTEEEFKKGSFFTIDSVFFSVDFWRYALSPLVETSDFTGIRLPPKPNRIRTSLRNFWGFNFVDTDIICDLYKK